MIQLTKLPEPALIRSAGITITGIAAYLLGREVSTEWVETVTTIYGLIAPLVAGYLIRRVVSPTPEYIGKHRPKELQ
ncbi:hypothetical protein IU459_11700 [Nocardia amamiensis]|uniref:Holin n=1 Tax=Nocardia amamiensis TaxID=404578 RepID=A0ABS0CNN1_9NOCA|nr:hypothetical protein [Nocardia amamiensis]MBF6298204.1 hypothetical protein [Nocardia amamiensis]